jgi:hypothetical protein
VDVRALIQRHVNLTGEVSRNLKKAVYRACQIKNLLVTLIPVADLPASTASGSSRGSA